MLLCVGLAEGIHLVLEMLAVHAILLALLLLLAPFFFFSLLTMSLRQVYAQRDLWGVIKVTWGVPWGVARLGLSNICIGPSSVSIDFWCLCCVETLGTRGTLSNGFELLLDRVDTVWHLAHKTSCQAEWVLALVDATRVELLRLLHETRSLGSSRVLGSK